MLIFKVRAHIKSFPLVIVNALRCKSFTYETEFEHKLTSLAKLTYHGFYQSR